MRMRYVPILLIPLLFMVASCGRIGESGRVNPLLTKYDTPFNVPPFGAIQLGDYEPALKATMAMQDSVISALVNNPESATFENTILALEYSGEELERVEAIFYNLLSAEASPEMQTLAQTIDPLLTAHSDDIFLNDKLFQRVKGVYEARATLGLGEEQLRLVEKTYKQFARHGANLDSASKVRLKAINTELSQLGLTFGQRVLAETNAMWLDITDSSKLAGVPESVVAEAAATAQRAGVPGWRFTPQKPSWIPFLTYSPDSALRAELYKTYTTRADRGNENDNKEVVRKIVNLRLEKAKLLGFPTYADYILDDHMAKTAGAVDSMLAQLWPPALKKAKEELKAMQVLAQAEGKRGSLAPSDWWYYAEKVRQRDYSLDEEMLRPYLSIDNARRGIFLLAEKLYGLTFKRLDSIPVYHPDVEVYEVFEADGSHLAVIYFDFYPRPGKGAGAWCTSFASQHKTLEGKNVDPIISIVCNFTPPSADAPALLNLDEFTTLFHEFGHALHAFFSEITYPSLGDTPPDFVEMPSQLNEHWALYPPFLKQIAVHYKTGDPMPDSLIEKMERSRFFNGGFVKTELFAASILDMDYHSITVPLTEDIDVYEKARMEAIGLIPEILPRYRSTYFSHIFDGGYASGYYGYTWSAMLDCDVWEAFTETGEPLNREVATRLRNTVLKYQGARDGAQLFRDFRGRGPAIGAFLRENGLAESAAK